MFEEGLNLLPCPHCGKPATLWAVDMSEGVYVFCDNCGMRGPLTEEMTEHAAITAWNALPRRADIERVERERDWLARQLAAQSGHSVVYWRKLAHRAVEGE